MADDRGGGLLAGRKALVTCADSGISRAVLLQATVDSWERLADE